MTADARLVIATGHGLSLALYAGGWPLAQVERPAEGVLDRALVPAIAGLMAGAGLARAGSILVDRGPGSFTGVRVGLAAARALGLAWGADVRGYAATRLVAEAAWARGARAPLMVALLAPRGQAWVQVFGPRPGPMSAVGPGELERLLHLHGSAGGEATGSAVPGAPEGLPRAALAHLLPAEALEAPEPAYVSRHDSAAA